MLQLIAEGRTTKQIAQLLDISVKTVETHRAQLMERLNIHDVAGLARATVESVAENTSDAQVAPLLRVQIVGRTAYLLALAFAAVGSMSAFDSGGGPVAAECGLPDMRSTSVTPQREHPRGRERRVEHVLEHRCGVSVERVTEAATACGDMGEAVAMLEDPGLHRHRR